MLERVCKKSTVSEKFAAEYLNVSEGWIDHLVHIGKLKIKDHEMGRQIVFSSLIEYQQERDKEREETLTELVMHSQALGLYE